MVTRLNLVFWRNSIAISAALATLFQSGSAFSESNKAHPGVGDYAYVELVIPRDGKEISIDSFLVRTNDDARLDHRSSHSEETYWVEVVDSKDLPLDSVSVGFSLKSEPLADIEPDVFVEDSREKRVRLDFRKVKAGKSLVVKNKKKEVLVKRDFQDLVFQAAVEDIRKPSVFKGEVRSGIMSELKDKKITKQQALKRLLEEAITCDSFKSQSPIYVDCKNRRAQIESYLEINR